MNIYEFTDYRQFLRQFYEEKKALNKTFSFRAMGQKLDLDAGFLVKVMNRQFHLRPKSFPKLFALCKFDELGGHRVKSFGEYPAPGTVTTNYNGYTEQTPVIDLIPDWNSFDFTSGSADLHDKGSVINGLPELFTGSAPDIGAYENGGDLWKPGCTIDTIALSPWPWSLNGSGFNKALLPEINREKDIQSG